MISTRLSCSKLLSRLSVAALLIAPTSAGASAFCDQLKAIGAAASAGFTSYRGEARNLTSSWVKYKATQSLPGASSCEIDSISKDFTCEWELGSRSEAKRQQAEFVQEVGLCLPGTRPRKLLEGEVGFFVGAWKQPGAYQVNVWSNKSTALVIITHY